MTDKDSTKFGAENYCKNCTHVQQLKPDYPQHVVLFRKHAEELGEYRLVGEMAARPVYQHLSKKWDCIYLKFKKYVTISKTITYNKWKVKCVKLCTNARHTFFKIHFKVILIFVTPGRKHKNLKLSEISSWFFFVYFAFQSCLIFKKVL